MPFAFDPNMDDEQKKQQAAQGSANQDQVVGGGQSGVVTSSSGPVSGSDQQKQSAAPTSSGSWTNLKSYLDANAGNSPANQVTANIKQVGDSANSGLQQAQNEFNQKVSSGSVQQNKSLVDDAVSNPTKYTGDPALKNQFVAQRDASYSGPQAFNELQSGQKAASDARQAQSYVDQSKTEGGRYALLQQMFARPTYTHGEQGLDQLLLQNDPNSRDQFQAVQDSYGGIGDREAAAEQTAAKTAQDAKANTQAARTYAQQALLGTNGHGGAINDFAGSLTKKAQDRQSLEDKQLSDISSALKSRDLTSLDPDEMKMLNLDGINSAMGLDPTSYLTPLDKSQLSAQTVANSDDYARMGALAQLAGVQNTWLPDASLAGTKSDAPLVNFNSDAFKQAVGDKQKAYNNELANTYINEGAGTFSNPSQTTTKNITDALADYKSQADWAQPYLAGGGNSSTFQPYVDQYQKLLAQFNAIGDKYGNNDTFKTAAPPTDGRVMGGPRFRVKG